MKYINYGTHLKVKDIYSSLDFYLGIGFQPVFSYGTVQFKEKVLKLNIECVEEEYNGIVFQLGEAKFEIADGHKAVKPAVFREDITSSKISAMIFVDDIDVLIDKLTKRNIDICVPVKEYPWGTRELVIKDPDEFVLVFIQ